MARAFASLFFATFATAQTITSVWLPETSSVGASYVASVVGSKDNAVTLAIADQADVDYYRKYGHDDDEAYETYTFHGKTAVESVYVSPYSKADVTYSLGCTKTAETASRVTCYYESSGPGLQGSICAPYKYYTDVYTSTYYYTYTAPFTVVTQVKVYDERTRVPSYCQAGATLPAYYTRVTSTVLGAGYTDNFQIAITAGAEKTGATAGATPSTASATATATATASATASTATTLATGSSRAPNATLSSTGRPQPAGNAASSITFAPVLAVLAAAAAAAFT